MVFHKGGPAGSGRPKGKLNDPHRRLAPMYYGNLKKLASAKSAHDEAIVVVQACAGKIIKGICREIRKSQQQVALVLGVSETNLSKIASGERPGGVEFWCALFDLYQEWKDNHDEDEDSGE